MLSPWLRGGTVRGKHVSGQRNVDRHMHSDDPWSVQGRAEAEKVYFTRYILRVWMFQGGEWSFGASRFWSLGRLGYFWGVNAQAVMMLQKLYSVRCA
jgi:hypothetical protein